MEGKRRSVGERVGGGGSGNFSGGNKEKLRICELEGGGGGRRIMGGRVMWRGQQKRLEY